VPFLSPPLNLTVTLGKAHLFSHLLSEYSTFAREVQTTVYALNGVEASVERETDFSTKSFRTMLYNLAEASTSAKKSISTLEQGRYKLVGFVEPEDLTYKHVQCTPPPSQETRGRKRKEREDDDTELREGSMRWREQY
jgi:hypothetical protein